MPTPERKSRWFVPTPGRLLWLVLVVEGLLFLAERFQWFAFNQHKGWTVLIAIGAVGAFLLLMFLWFFAALVFRWRFQFSILSLFVLTVAVALPFAWLETEVQAARGQREVVEEIQKLGGQVCYDYQYDLSDTTSRPPEPAWLRGLVGDDLFANVTQVILNNSGISDAGLEHLKGLPQVQELALCNTKVSDAGLEHLKGLTRLQGLYLKSTKVSGLEHLKGLTRLQGLYLKSTKVSGLEHLKGLTRLQGLYLESTKVSDAGLEHLKELTRLQTLDLVDTKVSDAGLQHLKGLPRLQVLDLRNTKVSDAGLEYLKGLPRLQWLGLSTTGVTDAGVKKLQQALPNCRITY